MKPATSNSEPDVQPTQIRTARTGVPIYKKILFPTDFSRGRGHALSHALRLAGVGEGEVIVQHVVSDYFERLPHWTAIFDIHELHKHMDGYVRGEMNRIVENGQASTLKMRPMVSKGNPAEEIQAASEEEMVDLIVMGPSSGPLTSQVIERGSRPVMAVPPKEAEARRCQKIRKILVAIDFSHRSQRLVDHVFRFHESLGATVYMLHVIEATCSMQAALREDYFTAPLNRMRDWALNQLANLVPTAFVSAPRIHRIVEVGRSETVIAQVGAEIGADLIAIGVHGQEGIERHLVGASAERILTASGIPILTLPA